MTNPPDQLATGVVGGIPTAREAPQPLASAALAFTARGARPPGHTQITGLRADVAGMTAIVDGAAALPLCSDVRWRDALREVVDDPSLLVLHAQPIVELT